MEGGDGGGGSGGATWMEEQQVFPPPSMWYKSTVASARSNMWAYSGGGIIVVVKPPPLQQKKKEDKVHGKVDEVADGVAAMNLGSADRLEAVPDESMPRRRWPVFSLMGEQRNRYTCLSFCQAPMDSLPAPGATLATGCEGGVVQIWNVEEKKCVYFHDSHNSQIAGLDWSAKNPMLVYSIDEGGSLVVWNVATNKLRTMNFGKIVPSCLQACPSEDDIVAFGTRGGNIFVANTLGNGTILSKVRHEEEVVVVMWKPKGQWDWLNDSDSRSSQHVLASGIHSVKVPSIRVWNSRGKDLGVIKISEVEQNKFRPFKTFVPVAWIKDPETGGLMLASSNKYGEICYCDRGDTASVIHGKHNHNAIFAIVQCGDILWSLSFEPVIIGYNLRKKEVECIIPTFKGCTSILPSPVDSNRVAVGGADSFIRVLRCSQGFPMHGDGVVKPPVISQKLKGKIVCITWHPTKDNCIAFGTDEGALGMFEVGTENVKCVRWFERRVNGVVYTVRFGPAVTTAEYQKELDAKKSQEANKGQKESTALYACGNGGVFMVHPSKLSNPLVDVLKMIQKANPVVEITGLEVNKGPHVKATDLLWTPDNSLLAVGFSDGRIELYSPPFLKLKCWIKCHTRAIQYLAWRPYDFSSGQLSTNSDKWLVSTSNDGTTRLYNLKDLFDESFGEDSVEPKMVISSEATLSEHAQRVISCAWSPHDKRLFVTVSYDATAIVWNVEDGSHIARYMGHQQRLVACCFHPSHPYQVITASDELERDFAIQVWDYRDHPFQKNLPRSKPPCVAVPIKAANEVSKIFHTIQVKTDLLSGESVNDKNNQKNPGSVKPARAGSVASSIEEGGKSKSKKMKTLMSATSNLLVNSPHADLLDEIQYLMEGKPLKSHGTSDPDVSGSNEGDNHSEAESTNRPKDPTLHLGILENREKCRKQLEFEKTMLETHNPDGAAILSFWLEDSSYIEKCIKSGKVTESMIMIAAGIGRSLYLKAVESYATSVLQEQDYLKAGHYFYLCGKHDKAIEVLVTGKLFREAVALVKSTLPEEDPRVKDVMEKWAKQLIANGNFELAAKVYCSMEEYSSALLVIEKRAHAFAYKTGCYVADKIKDEVKLTMFGVLFILDGLKKGSYDECFSVLETYPHLQWLKTIVKSHETIHGFVKYLMEVRDDKVYKMWAMVMDNCWIEVQSNFQPLDTVCNNVADTKKKINGCISVSIPQNDHDAMLIITKFITLALLGMMDADIHSKALECAKLAKTWLAKKNVYLYFATVSSICKLSFPSLEIMANQESSELTEIFLDASVIYLRAVLLKTEIENPAKAEQMKYLWDDLFSGPYSRFKEKYMSTERNNTGGELQITLDNVSESQSVNIDLSVKPVDINPDSSNTTTLTNNMDKEDEVTMQ